MFYSKMIIAVLFFFTLAYAQESKNVQCNADINRGTGTIRKGDCARALDDFHNENGFLTVDTKGDFRSFGSCRLYLYPARSPYKYDLPATFVQKEAAFHSMDVGLLACKNFPFTYTYNYDYGTFTINVARHSA